MHEEIGREHAWFALPPRLCGVKIWGDVDGAAVIRVALRVQEQVATWPWSMPMASLLDLRHVATFAAAAQEPLRTLAERHRTQWAKHISRQVVIIPPGAQRLLVAGFFHLAPPPFEWRLVATVDEAARELDEPRIVPALANLDARFGALWRALVRHELLARGHYRIGHVARALGVSARTLQRRLDAEGTTFQSEVVATRIASAKQRMLASGVSLTEVAYDAGFASPQHFSTLFRRETGETPTAWRARLARGDKRLA